MLDLAFGAWWIVLSIVAVTVHEVTLRMIAVGWATLGGYVLGQSIQERRAHRG